MMRTWHRIVLTIIFGFGSPVLAVVGLDKIPAIHALNDDTGFLLAMLVGFILMLLSVIIFNPFKYYYDA